MITELNEKQVALMEVVKQEWLDLFFKGKKIDKHAARSGVKWLYKFSGFKEPMVIFVDSPLGAQYAQVMLKAWFKEVGKKKLSQVWSQVQSQVRSQVWSQVRSQVRSQVWSQVWSQVRSQVWSQVWSQVRSHGLEYEWFASYGNAWDLGWLSFYDFFDRIGVKMETKNLHRFMKLMKAGVYDMIQLDGVCIVCSYPTTIARDTQNNMHSDRTPAIQWDDGYKLYYLHGVHFPEDLWKQVTSKQMPFADILKIVDIDQRKQAMKYGNVWDFVKHNNGKELDTAVKVGANDGRKIHYWLYEFPAGELFNKTVHYAIYEDSMLGAAMLHMQGVPPVKTVAEAFAWKQSDDFYAVTPEEWNALVLDRDFA